MKFLAGFYFVITVFTSFYNLYNLQMQTNELLKFIQCNHKMLTESVLTVAPFRKPDRIMNILSGFHIIENNLMEDENSWENVAFSRYYGIKGIRVSKDGLGHE